MTLKTVDIRLLDVAEITESQGGLAADVDVCHELMAHCRRGHKGGGHNVVVIITTIEYLVIRLSEIGREHHPYKKQLHLIAQGGIASEEAEAICGSSRRH